MTIHIKLRRWQWLLSWVVLVCCGSPTTVLAQRAFADSLAVLRQRYLRVDTSMDSDVMDADPLYYRLMGPPTFYSRSLDGVFSIDSIGENPTLEQAIDRALVEQYMKHPRSFRHYDAQYRRQELPTITETKTSDLQKQMTTILNRDAKEQNEDAVEQSIVLDDDIGLRVERPNFWKTSANFTLQFTQNYFSENWYKGGNNSGTLLSSLTLQAIYNDQRHVTWENRLLMRLGFITTPSDTSHSYITNNDKLNLYSKLGVKARKSFYYTFSLEANTQFMPGYRTNDRRTYSNFLAPLDVFASLGIDYKPSLKNGNTLSVAVLPLSYKLRYIGDEDENVHKTYNMVGKDTQEDYGSKLELNAKIGLAKSLTWKCRAYYFTSYEYAEAELENVLSYAFSKYISTELYTLWRFDDNRSRDYYDDNLGYFQFKEYFTFGINYTF